MAWPLAAGMIGGAFSAFGASRQQRSSERMARQQMDFQERMSNTAFTRAAHDLNRAGLNRVLAIGSPASTPGGAMGQAQNIGAAGVSGATAAAQAAANVQLTKEQARKVGFEADMLQPKAQVAGAVGDATKGATESILDVAKGAFDTGVDFLKRQYEQYRKNKAEQSTSAKDAESNTPAKNSATAKVDAMHMKFGFDPDKARRRVLKAIDEMDVDTRGWTDEQKLQWFLDNPEKVKRYNERKKAQLERHDSSY